MHVLVVENDLDTRDLLYKALIDAGYEVSQAKGFSEALQLSGQHPDIGLVVVDLHTCVRLSGVEMAGEMRQRLSNSHYILTSSDWDALDPTCPDDMTILRKPYGRIELLRAVCGGVARRNERRRFGALKRPNRRRA
ncbi:response regulator [Dyella dinghuensis]|nr:response regulator [Dyella dinghuensis]